MAALGGREGGRDGDSTDSSLFPPQPLGRVQESDLLLPFKTWEGGGGGAGCTHTHTHF